MPAQTLIYKTVQGVDLSIDVYPAESSRPGVILSLHGGGMIAGSRADIAGDGPGVMRELLNEAGYTVVSPDYRLAPESKLADVVEDLSDAWNWLHKALSHQMDIDVTRVGAMGRSAGGYLSLLLGTLVQPRPAAIASFYGYGSLLEDWVSQPSEHYRRQQPLFSEAEVAAYIGDRPAVASGPEQPRIPIYFHARQTGRWMTMVTGLDREKDEHLLRALSPNLNIDSEFPPTLLLHGTGDTDVPYEASVRVEAAMQAAGRDVRLISLEGADHLFDRSVTRAEVESAAPGAEAGAVLHAVAFFERHLG